MKYIPLLLVFALAGCTTPAQNLLRNGGFESLDGWTAPGPVFSSDTKVFHDGKASLKYNNSRSDLYKMATQTLPALPDTVYRVSAWIKTQNIAGPDSSGATLAVEWKNKQGNFLGGSYPRGFSGTHDWTLLQATTARSPANVATMALVCYARKGCTGTAWFDDASLEVVKMSDWSVTVTQPSFRWRLDGLTKISFTVRVPDASGTVIATFDGPGVSKKQTYPVNAEKLDLTLDTGNLTYGQYTFKADWTNGGKVVGSYVQPMTVGAELSKVVTLNGNILVVGGKPFFPIGIYDSKGWDPKETPARLKEIAGAGFNCVLPYGFLDGGVTGIRKYLDAAQAAGLKVIGSVKDLYSFDPQCPKQLDGWTNPAQILAGVVQAVHSHPALLAWYVNDEVGPDHYADLRASYDLITKLDPDHVCLTISNQPGAAYALVGTSDIIGTDPYPVPVSPLTVVQDWVRAAQCTGRPIWTAIQLFNKADYHPGESSRGPTGDEVRAMAFNAVASGATGILMYSYYNIKAEPDFDTKWRAVKRVCHDLNTLAPIIVSGEVQPTAVGGISSRSWKLGGVTYTLVVNPVYDSTAARRDGPTWPTGWKSLFVPSGPAFSGSTTTVPSLAVQLYASQVGGG